VLQAWQLEDEVISTQRELAEDRAADDADATADAEDEWDPDVADEEPAQPAAPVMADEAASAPQPAAASLQNTCISPSPGTIRGTIQVPASGFSALDSALASSVARRLAARFETR
jgi:hypothetical protein